MCAYKHINGGYCNSIQDSKEAGAHVNVLTIYEPATIIVLNMLLLLNSFWLDLSASN